MGVRGKGLGGKGKDTPFICIEIHKNVGIE